MTDDLDIWEKALSKPLTIQDHLGRIKGMLILALEDLEILEERLATSEATADPAEEKP